MINKENIEESIFDYFEGNLSSSEMKELELFIQNNQEYQVDFDAWKNATVQSEPVTYKFADDLLVEETLTPKVWWKWLRGSALLLLLAGVSFGLVNKLNGSKVKVAEQSIPQKNTSEDLSSIGDQKLTDSFGSSVHQVAGSEKAKINVDFKQSIENSDALSSNIQNVKNNNVTIKVGEINSTRNSLQTSTSTSSDSFNASNTHKSAVGRTETKVLEQKQLLGLIDIPAIANKAELYPYAFENVKSSRYKKVKHQPYGIEVANLKDPLVHYNLSHTLNENASFAGNSEGVRLEHMYRVEWPRFSTEQYSTHVFSADAYVNALKGGLGFIYSKDVIGHGKLSSATYALVYSPKITLKGVSIEPSVKASYNTRSILWSEINSNDAKDPRTDFIYGSIAFLQEEAISSEFRYMDLGAGILINAKNFYAGFQYDHLSKPTYSDEIFDQEITIPGKLTFQAGTDIRSYKRSYLIYSPSVNYIQFGLYQSLWLNNQVAYKNMLATIGLATNNQGMFSLGYKNDQIRLVYSLGLSQPPVSVNAGSKKYYESHQVGLRVNLKPRK